MLCLKQVQHFAKNPLVVVLEAPDTKWHSKRVDGLDREIGRWGDGEMGRWGDRRKRKLYV
ncbi:MULTISPECIES: hypothetical protein [unclassified Moorena]|uniref:hypothetical protein n=1 Tax=unclassified Moorena TaxID=2683338 RepID=UPI00144E9EED|nr:MULTISPECIES: hypothetical protein [unclassified Moorena]NEQ56998.1 hypothetical protein [Moorena sp. SIO4A1]